MRRWILSIAALVCLCTVPAQAQVTLDNPLDEPQPYWTDSGLLPNLAGAARSLHTETIDVVGASWLRVYFGDEVELGEGSFLRITSLLDGEVQELDAEALEAWSHSSAYFNGDRITVELVGGPNTQRNRMVTTELAFAEIPAQEAGSCGICGPDDRVPTLETYASRLLPAGCSTTTYNTDSCIVSAGHCVSGGMVVQFNVPNSSPTCTLNHPPVAEQFPIEQFLFSNGGVGNDWAVLVPGENNLGEKPFERYGELRPIATSAPTNGDSLTITGYGVDSQCTLTQVQQTSGGSVLGVSTLFLNHSVDATFGNSGSSLLRNGQEILGIATHCPCPNVATRIDHPSFVAARESLCPQTELISATLTGMQVLVGTPTGDLSSVVASDDSYLVVDSASQGNRNNTLTVVEGDFPFNGATELNVTVELGPADVTPVFLRVALFNFDTGLYNTLAFGIVSTTGDETIELLNVPNANAYVDGSGQVRVRVAQTARGPQTPDGFTKQIDSVTITGRP